ncbi:DNA repair protein RadA [bacterium]|nr:DNA repair protein RadA [bacterium]
MAKDKVQFVCQECGAVYPRWQGRCNSCDAWNSIVEEVIKKTNKKEHIPSGMPIHLKDIEEGEFTRCSSGFSEMDRVLGGGIIPGSTILVGGSPGIGKSTLLLQISLKLAERGEKVLYVTGEESEQQIKIRAKRLGEIHGGLYLETETNTSHILASASNLKPGFIVIDSIQTMQNPELSSIPGSISQVRAAAQELVEFAKKNDIVVFMIGHITKGGVIAGPKVLEHTVDGVFYFEGDSNHEYRIIRAMKNRYGSTNELGIFEMTSSGLREVDNPSEFFMSSGENMGPGSVIIPAIEGTRPFLIEIQALVTPSAYGIPQRVVTGLNTKRVSLLCALLEKRVGIPLGTQDVFLNIVGGVQIEEPAIDLGVVMAIVSSFRDIPLKNKLVVCGEVGLNGEIRPVSHIPIRVKESARLGFKYFLLPHKNQAEISKNLGISLIDADSLFKAFREGLAGSSKQ